mmetsp:Transcript_77181/g.226402  ORF Transcript_77181/g.226402 Transcript_77181/m.226402 type:complete len:357 (+) Transcript_77181:615-1685(+)
MWRELVVRRDDHDHEVPQEEDRYEGLHQVGDQEGPREVVQPGLHAERSLHRKGVEDVVVALQVGKQVAFDGVGIDRKHEPVRQDGCDPKVRQDVHEAGHRIEHRVVDLGRVVELEAGRLSHEQAHLVHDLVPHDHDERQDDFGPDVRLVPMCIRECGDVVCVGDVHAGNPQYLGDANDQPAPDKVADKLAPRQAHVRKGDGVRLHVLAGQRDARPRIARHVEAARPLARLQRRVPRVLGLEDGEGVARGPQAGKEALDLLRSGLLLRRHAVEPQQRRVEPQQGAPRDARPGPLGLLVRGRAAAAAVAARPRVRAAVPAGALRLGHVGLGGLVHQLILVVHVPADGQAHQLLACGLL